jgi:multidrug efflux pump subunit AcrB
MANFFIRRPIVAIVISILMVLMGLFSLKGLSIEQYPFLAPPSIRVTAPTPALPRWRSSNRWRRPSSRKSTASTR